MIIKMNRTVPGAANDAGTATMAYVKDRRYDMSADWQQDLAVVFLNEDWADEVGAKMATPVTGNKMLDGAPENKGGGIGAGGGDDDGDPDPVDPPAAAEAGQSDETAPGANVISENPDAGLAGGPSGA